MILKSRVEDFVVDEVFDLNGFESIGDKEFYYFLFEKRGITQMSVFREVQRVFGVRQRDIGFAGTKDKEGVTRQLISIRSKSDKKCFDNMKYFNSKFENMKLEYLGKFAKQVNLGDSLGNRFEIVVRGLDKEIEFKNLKILNLYGEQRFGFANNSDKVGKLLVQGMINEALKEVMCAIGEKGREDARYEFVEYLKKNWEKVVGGEVDEVLGLFFKKYGFEKEVLEYLKKYKMDVYGAFRVIPKKIRTLYLGAYQARLFNEMVLGGVEGDELELLAYSNYDVYEELLVRDGIKKEDLGLETMPELELFGVKRRVEMEFDGLEIKWGEDEMFEGKKKCVLKFWLGKGSYATEVIRQLFS